LRPPRVRDESPERQARRLVSPDRGPGERRQEGDQDLGDDLQLHRQRQQDGEPDHAEGEGGRARPARRAGGAAGSAPDGCHELGRGSARHRQQGRQPQEPADLEVGAGPKRLAAALSQRAGTGAGAGAGAVVLTDRALRMSMPARWPLAAYRNRRSLIPSPSVSISSLTTRPPTQVCQRSILPSPSESMPTAATRPFWKFSTRSTLPSPFSSTSRRVTFPLASKYCHVSGFAPPARE